MLKSKDLLGLRDISAEEIKLILDTAEDIKKGVKSGKKCSEELKGKTLVTLFYENSTRTRCSFELAGKYLGATEVNISASSSSVQKGETLIDTGKTLQALKADFIAIRHPMGGAPHLLAKTVGCSILNGGDGMNEHPTQALLDMLSIREEFGTLKGLKVAILGDIKHSRVAKSNLFGLTKMGAEVWVYAPKTLIPEGFDQLGAHIATSREQCVDGANAVMGLRIQLERQSGGLFPSLSEYSRYYGVNGEVMKHAAKDAIVVHPGPVNRGVELTPQLIDGETSRIEDQVTSGLCIRMAVLKLLNQYREAHL
ncbi:MAG: aspartate carbamoyltransferase catalytic subunit [Clostridia bacterium]|nr:aspartate carbamoyltransferase catalytic subunit [Clostridia bacterium]